MMRRVLFCTISLSLLASSSICLASLPPPVPDRLERTKDLGLQAQAPFYITDLEISLEAVPEGFHIDLDELCLVQFEVGAIRGDGENVKRISQREKLMMIMEGRRLFDVTYTMDLHNISRGQLHTALNQTSNQDERLYPTIGSPDSRQKISHTFATISLDMMRINLESFTSFRTRFFASREGKESQQWLHANIWKATKSVASPTIRNLIEIIDVSHHWAQNSIIARINGQDANVQDGVIIFGAHLDSINRQNLWEPAPGADDNGSGSIVLLEIYRSLLSSGFVPKRTIELHWYSAEEVGCLGSRSIAYRYAKEGVKVMAMIQFDETAWVTDGQEEVMAVVTDHVNPKLVEHTKNIVDMYLNISWVETTCGYACSDHAVWTEAGYPSAFVTEGPFESNNPHHHTKNDRIDISDEFSFEHMAHFVRFGIAFAVETAGWISGS